MAYFDPNVTIESKARNISLVPIKDGQFLIVTDTKNLFYDFGDTRIQLTDIIDIDTEAARQALLTPINKFYFVKETDTLWRYNNGEWTSWSAGGGTGGASEAVFATLTENGWVNGQQVLSIPELGADQNGIIGLTQDATGGEVEAASLAELRVSGQAAGSLTISMGGKKPSCDIPVVIILLN